MTPPTPPPTTYDHKPAYDFAESMRERSDLVQMIADCGPSHWWKEWALVEAYMAGRAAAQAEEREACAKVADDMAEECYQCPGTLFSTAGGARCQEVGELIRKR